MKKLFLIILFLFPIFATASTIAIKVDTLNISINTLAATIVLPKTIVVSKILDGNSAIIFWIKPASFDEKTNTIYFAGITPGGFEGQRQILSLVGNFKEKDLSNISFKDVTAFKNDGQGTPTQVKFSVLSSSDITDSVPPEPFTPIISESPDIFNGHRFLSFVTEDKGVGIDHYEYAFVWFGSPTQSNWKPAESPMELTTSSLFEKIFIKALDKSGNERIQSTVGPYYYYLWSTIWVIILALVLCVLFYIRRFFR